MAITDLMVIRETGGVALQKKTTLTIPIRIPLTPHPRKKVQSAARLTSANSAGLLCVLSNGRGGRSAARRGRLEWGGGTFAACQLAASLFDFSRSSGRRQAASSQGPNPRLQITATVEAQLKQPTVLEVAGALRRRSAVRDTANASS